MNALRTFGIMLALAGVGVATSILPGCEGGSTAAPDVDIIDASVDATGSGDASEPLHPRPSRDGLALLQHRIGHLVQLLGEPNRLDLAGVACVLVESAEAAANANELSPRWDPPIRPPKCHLVGTPSMWTTEAVDGGVKHSYDAATGGPGGVYVASSGRVSITPPTITFTSTTTGRPRMGGPFHAENVGAFTFAEARIEGEMTATGATTVILMQGLPEQTDVELGRTISRVRVDVSYRFGGPFLDGGTADDSGGDAGADPPFCIASGTIGIDGISRAFAADASTYTLAEEPYRVTFSWTDCDLFTCTYSQPESPDKTEKSCTF